MPMFRPTVLPTPRRATWKEAASASVNQLFPTSIGPCQNVSVPDGIAAAMRLGGADHLTKITLQQLIAVAQDLLDRYEGE